MENTEATVLRTHRVIEMNHRRCYRFALPIILFLLFGMSVRSQQSLHSSSPVEAQMHSVNLHLDRSTVLEVSHLRGQMMPTERERPATFDDPNSFVIRITSAEIAISTG